MNKIAFYIDTMYRGGAQRVMSNLVEYFTEHGYSTILINDFIQDDKIPQYTLPAGLKRVYLRKNLQGNKFTKNITRMIRLRKIIDEEKPDVILSFLGRPNKRMLLATIGLNVKKVVSVRNDPNREYGSKFIKKFSAGLLFRLADGCVFQTKEASTYFPKSVQKKSTIILNPVSEKFYSVNRSSEPHDIVNVGRLEQQKNHKLLINAYAKIKDEFPTDNLIIYGEGPLRNELEEYIDKLGLESRVILAGNISEVNEALAKAKLFVLTSDYEGMPNALMEAMAVGVPCIATDCPCGGPRELIINCKEGILVNTNDVESLVAAIREVMDNPQMADDMAAEAKKASNKFRNNIILEQWEGYLLSIAT